MSQRFPHGQKNETISKLLIDWSNNYFGGTQIADLTQSLMQQYVNAGGGLNAPVMVQGVANCSYLWEHNGYNFWYQAMVQDVVLTTVSYLLSCHYIASVKQYEVEALRQKDLKSMQASFGNYGKAVNEELVRIKARNAKYRRYNPGKVTFSIYAKTYNFRRWFENNRDVRFPPRDDSKSTAIASCNKILSDSGLDYELALTPQMATDIYNYYNKGKKDRTSIYRILVDSVGFVGIPTHFDPGILLVKGGDKYEHEKGKKEIPMYKIFHWEVYTKYHNGDYFGIRTCLNDHCGLENHNILFKCDITTKTGQINKLGGSTRWSWYYLPRVE